MLNATTIHIENEETDYGIIRTVQKIAIMRKQTEGNYRDSGRDISFWKRRI